MKKLMIVLALAMTASAANAQYYYHRGPDVGDAVVVGSMAGILAALSTVSAQNSGGCYNCEYMVVQDAKATQDAIAAYRVSGEASSDFMQKLSDAATITKSDDQETNLQLLDKAAAAIEANPSAYLPKAK